MRSVLRLAIHYKCGLAGDYTNNLTVEGKISNQTFKEWNRETGAKKLPERVHSTERKKAGKKRTKRKTQKRRR